MREATKEYILMYGDTISFTKDILEKNYMRNFSHQEILATLISSCLSKISSLQTKVEGYDNLIHKHKSEINYKVTNGINWLIPERIFNQELTASQLLYQYELAKQQEARESHNLAIYKWIESNWTDYSDLVRIYS